MTNATHPIVVSVVIPAYAAAAFIQTALDSVLQQSFGNYEIIVVNDGSPDTKLLEGALTPYWARIRYFNRANMGPSAARNYGILQARGEYVAFLDSDDFWMPDHLEQAMRMFRHDPSLGLVYGDSFLLKNGQVIGRTFARESQVLPVQFESLLEETCTVTTSTTVASRGALLQAGLFDERLRRCEDFDLWLRMAFRGVKMTHHSEATACRTVSQSGLSADGHRMKCDRLGVFAKVASTLPLSSDQRKVLNERYEKTEAAAHLDRFKTCLYKGNFADAASAARHQGLYTDGNYGQPFLVWNEHLTRFVYVIGRTTMFLPYETDFVQPRLPIPPAFRYRLNTFLRGWWQDLSGALPDLRLAIRKTRLYNPCS